MERAERLVDAGLLIFDGNRVRLTARGRLLSNEVFQEFLELAADAPPVATESLDNRSFWRSATRSMIRAAVSSLHASERRRRASAPR